MNKHKLAAGTLLLLIGSNAAAIVPPFTPSQATVVDGKATLEPYTGATPKVGDIITGISCKNKWWNPVPTQAAAEIAISAQTRGAAYKVLSCTERGFSLEMNCFSSVTCEAEVVEGGDK